MLLVKNGRFAEKGKTFRMCCNAGKVKMPKLSEVPQEFLQLFNWLKVRLWHQLNSIEIIAKLRTLATYKREGMKSKII